MESDDNDSDDVIREKLIENEFKRHANSGFRDGFEEGRVKTFERALQDGYEEGFDKHFAIYRSKGIAKAVNLRTTDYKERQVEELKIENAQLLEDIKAIDDKYKRALADMENQRQRYNRLIAETKEFAVHGFCKDLIEITDVMSMALQNIKPEEVGKDNYEGISMIDKRIVSIFKKHGLISLNPKGEKFDPNKHQAMFEIPDASKEPGTVGEVVKVGWQLHDRIVRPAMVGVWKRPEE
ncbi:GrpE protein-like 1, mitochondrial, partial [Fragariocoptes setiger]